MYNIEDAMKKIWKIKNGTYKLYGYLTRVKVFVTKKQSFWRRTPDLEIEYYNDFGGHRVIYKGAMPFNDVQKQNIIDKVNEEISYFGG